MIGNVGFLVLYLVSGLFGSVTSLFVHPLVASAGASGAIFGIYGALLGLLLLNRHSVPANTLPRLRGSAVGFIAYNLFCGMLQPNIDTAAHVGGLVAGFLGGLILSQPLTQESLATRRVRNFRVLALGVVLVTGGMIGTYARYQDLTKLSIELASIDDAIISTQQTVQKITEKAHQDDLANEQYEKKNPRLVPQWVLVQRRQSVDADFANALELHALPQWRAARNRLQQVRYIPEELKDHIKMLKEYMQLYQDSMEMYIQALRDGDEKKLQLSKETEILAGKLAQKMMDDPDKSKRR